MFRFRLQRVLDLRARVERDAATALVSAQEAAEAARAEEERLQAARAQLAASLTTGMAMSGGSPSAALPAPSVGELRNLGFLLERMDQRVAGAAAETAAAAQVVESREDALRAAYRDRRTLDRLRERHHDAFRAAEAQADRTAMDEIALTRFTQSAASSAASSGTARES